MKYLIALLCIISLAACNKPDSPPDIVTGLVVNITLDDNAYESVSGTWGTTNNTTLTADRHGNSVGAMQFTAVDSSNIDFGDLNLASFDSTNQLTISCWVKVSDSTGNIAILSKRGFTGPFEYSIDNHFAHNGFTMDNWIANGATSVYGLDPLKAYAPIALNQWQHIAYVADGSVLKVYINGALQGGTDQRNSGTTFSNTAGHLVIGNGGGYGKNYYFNGAINDIKIYNRALTADAVKALAQQ